MSKLKTEIYTASTGVEMTLSWNNEEEFSSGKAFLQRMVGDRMGRDERHPDKPDCYYLENERQFEALLAFRQELRRRRSGQA
ncbi:MAG: hypothetical protein WA418_23085 [Bradyrhizobium sp.]